MTYKCQACYDRHLGCLICNASYWDGTKIPNPWDGAQIQDHDYDAISGKFKLREHQRQAIAVVMAVDNVISFPVHKIDREFLAETGLGSCDTCGGAEASMPTHCPQKKMGSYLADLVQRGDVDFKDGRWVDLRRVDLTGGNCTQVIIDDPFNPHKGGGSAT